MYKSNNNEPLLAILMFSLFTTLPLCAVTTRYVAATAGTFSGGTACNGQTAITPTTFASTSLAAGDITYICGNIGSTGFNGLSPKNGGSSGNPIVIKFDTGASISATYINVGIELAGISYVVVDGGTACGTTPGQPVTSWITSCSTNLTGTGIISNTAVGTTLGNTTVATVGVDLGQNGGCSSTGNIEIKNLIITNLYVKNNSGACGSGCDNSAGANDSFGIWGFSCGSNILVHDNTLEWARGGVKFQAANGASNFQFYNNVTAHNVWGMYAGENNGGSATAGPIYFYDNDVNNGSDWSDSDGDYHLDGLFTAGSATAPAPPGSHWVGIYMYNNYLHGSWVAANSGQCPTGYSYDDGESTGFYFFNNIINVLDGYACNGELAPGGFPAGQLNIFNNTFMAYGGAACKTATSAACIAIGSGVVNAAGAMTAENNVSIGQNYNLGFFDSGLAGIALMDYNDYYNWDTAYGGWAYANGGPFYNTLAQWQEVTCGSTLCDIHGSQANPQLNAGFSPAAPVFGTSLYSKCTGQPNPGLGALCYDMLGNARPSSGAWVTGALNGAISVPNAPTGLSGTAN